MVYYRLFESSEPEVGYFPQVSNSIVEYDIYDPKSSYHINFSKAGDDTLWPIAKLSGKAKKTDLISHSLMGLSSRLLISEKLYKIMSAFASEGIQYVQSKLVIRKGKEESYWIVNPYLSDYSFLDISNCEFVYTDPMIKLEFGSVTFRSAKEFIEAYLQNRKDVIAAGYPDARPLIIKKIAFSPDSIADFCVVLGILGGIGFFVSERLKEEILRRGITGIVFKDPNSKYPF